MALGPLQDQFKAHAEESAKLIAFQQQLLEAGLKSGSVDDSVIKTGAAATKDVVGSVAEKAEKQAKERFSDAMFLALLQNGDLDAIVAENIFGNMSDAEISAVVSDIETQTGKSFEDYAKDILGDDMPERAVGESDDDYQRRVLIAVGDEVLNDDLSIKAGYENDPLARIMRTNEFYIETKSRIETLKAKRQAGASIEQAAPILSELTDTDEEADLTAAEMKDDTEVVLVARSAEEKSFDDDSHEVDREAGSSLFLDGLGMGDALETASADLGQQFMDNAAPLPQGDSLDSELNIPIPKV